MIPNRVNNLVLILFDTPTTHMLRRGYHLQVKGCNLEVQMDSKTDRYSSCLTGRIGSSHEWWGVLRNLLRHLHGIEIYGLRKFGAQRRSA
jgi:hypothetical protein